MGVYIRKNCGVFDRNDSLAISENNKRNLQNLIFTTHDVGLLDQKLLRRDRIWSAEKDEKNAETDLYPPGRLLSEER